MCLTDSELAMHTYLKKFTLNYSVAAVAIVDI